MKKILKIFSVLAACVALSVSCEDNRLDGMYDDQVYFVDGGEQIVYVDHRDYADFSFTVYKAGIGQAPASVDIVVDGDFLEQYNEKNNTAYNLLDENCYTLKKNHFEFAADDISYSGSIELDGVAINSFQGLGKKDNVIPLKLVSTSDVSEKLGYIILVPILD